MSGLFTIDCHACGATNTIDTETMRRVDLDTMRTVKQAFNDGDLAAVESVIVSRAALESVRRITEFRCGGSEVLPSFEDDPEPAA